MPRILAKTTEITHEKWLELRRTGLGGSDAAVVVGLSPYRSKIELWADKTNRLPDKEDNEAMRVGRDLEEYVAKRFAEASGKKVRRRNAIFRHDEYDYITANVDREIVGENAGLECKTTSAFARADFEGGEIPLYYYCQCCHYMNVMGYDRMYLAVLVMGRAFYWFTIERDEQECEALLEAESAFWQDFIVPDVRPEPDGSESAERTVRALTPDWQEDSVPLFGEECAVNELAKVQAEKKRLEEREKALKQKLTLLLNGCAEGFTADWRVSCKPQTRHTVDSKRLKTRRPEIYAEYLKTTESRVFKLSERKES